MMLDRSIPESMEVKGSIMHIIRFIWGYLMISLK